MFRVKKVHAEHLKGEENGVLQVIGRVHRRQSLFQALAPYSQIVLVVNVSPQLQETPHHVRKYILLL